MIIQCKAFYQNRVCVLDKYHDDDVHIDKTGFKFIDDEYPDRSGNGPSGYPMNNKAFDKAVQEVLDRRKDDADKAEKFLKRLGRVKSGKS